MSLINECICLNKGYYQLFIPILMSQWNPILITGGFLIAVKKGAATITGQFQADDILNQPF